MAQQPYPRHDHHQQQQQQQLLLQHGQPYGYVDPQKQGYANHWAAPGGSTLQGPSRPSLGLAHAAADPRPWQQHGPLSSSSQPPWSLEASFVRQSRAAMLLVDKWTGRILEASDGALPALGLGRAELSRMSVSDLGEGPGTTDWHRAVAALTSSAGFGPFSPATPYVALRLLIREAEEGQAGGPGGGHLRGQLVDLRLQQLQSAEGRGVVCSLIPAPAHLSPPSPLSPGSPPSASLEDWPQGDPLGHLPSAPPAPRAAPPEAQAQPLAWEAAGKGAIPRPRGGRPVNQTSARQQQQQQQQQHTQQRHEEGAGTGKGVLKKLGNFLKGRGSERAMPGSEAAGGAAPAGSRPALSPMRPGTGVGGRDTDEGHSGSSLKKGLRKVTSLQMPPPGKNPRLTRSSTAGPQYQGQSQQGQSQQGQSQQGQSQQGQRHGQHPRADESHSTEAGTTAEGAAAKPLRAQIPGRLGDGLQREVSPNAQHPVTRSKSAKAYTGSPRGAATEGPTKEGRGGAHRVSDSPGKPGQSRRGSGESPGKSGQSRRGAGESPGKAAPAAQGGRGAAQQRQGKLELRLDDDDDSDPEPLESPLTVGSRFTPRARSCNAASSAAAAAAFASMEGDLDTLESPSAFWTGAQPGAAPLEDSLASVSSSTSRPTRAPSSKSSSRRNTPRRAGSGSGSGISPTSPGVPQAKTQKSSSSLRRLHLQGPTPMTSGKGQGGGGDRDGRTDSESYGHHHSLTPGRRLGWGRRSFGVPGVDAAGELFVRSGPSKGARFRWPEGADVGTAWHSLTLRRHGQEGPGQPLAGVGAEDSKGGKAPMKRFSSMPQRSPRQRGLEAGKGRHVEVSPRAARTRSRSQGRQAERRRQGRESSPRGRPRSRSGPMEGRQRTRSSAAGEHREKARREVATRASVAPAAQSPGLAMSRASSSGSARGLRLAALEAGFAPGLEVPHDDSAMLCEDEGAPLDLQGLLEARAGGLASSPRPGLPQGWQRSSDAGAAGGDAQATTELHRIQQQLKWLEQQEKEVEQQLQEVMGQAAEGTSRRPGRRRSHSQGSGAVPSAASSAVTPSSKNVAAPKGSPSDAGAGPQERPPAAASNASPAPRAPEPPLPAAGPQADNGGSSLAAPAVQMVPQAGAPEAPQAAPAPAFPTEGDSESRGGPAPGAGASLRTSQKGPCLCSHCFDRASSWLGSLLEEAQVGCALVALDSQTIVSCNHALTLLLGCTALDLKGLQLPCLAPSPRAQISIRVWLEGMGRSESSQPQSLECVLGTPASVSRDASRGARGRIPQALRITATQATCLMPFPQALQCSEKVNMRLILFAAIAQL